MKRTHIRQLTGAIAAFATLSLSVTAFAQYAWIDDKGTRQYSDMPPPASVPADRILKAPRGSVIAPAAPDAPATAAAPKAEMSVAEKEADYRKRRAEQAEKEKKAAEEARLAAEKSKNCERARDYHRALESGERLARTDKNGERSFLTDEQRERELRETRRVLDDCK